MAAPQIYPPHKLPGLDQFLAQPTALHDVTITATPGHDLEIRAITTGPPGSPDVPLEIRRLNIPFTSVLWAMYGSGAMIVSIGDRTAPYRDGAVTARELDLDRDTIEGAILWAAYVELREAYRDANRILDAYMDQYRTYIVEKLANSISYFSKPRRGEAQLLTKVGEHR
jgi:hypothetical protein